MSLYAVPEHERTCVWILRDDIRNLSGAIDIVDGVSSEEVNGVFIESGVGHVDLEGHLYLEGHIDGKLLTKNYLFVSFYIFQAVVPLLLFSCIKHFFHTNFFKKC